MSDVEVTVESNEPDSTDPVEEITEAVDHVVDVNQAEDIGALKAVVSQLRSDVDGLMGTVGYHDELITLHDHSELVTTSELTECEDRLAGMIEQTAVIEPEPIEEPSTDEPESSTDDPPNSRKGRRSIADMYYGKS